MKNKIKTIFILAAILIISQLIVFENQMELYYKQRKYCWLYHNVIKELNSYNIHSLYGFCE